jgi:FAD/FMN-containing dehydrogenase
MNKSSFLTQALQELRSIVGSNNYIDDVKDMGGYLSDWRNNFSGQSPLILKPTNTNMVSDILLVCHKNSISVVPQGGNTGLVGGSVPSNDGDEVIVSLEKMNNILDIDPMNYTMTVEAGCILSNIQDAALNVNRIFPLSLAAEGSCQIGGNLATNAGGTGVLRYGNAKELVLGLEVVLADGTIINSLKRLRKDNTGYDLKQLFMGSEGTLGIITKSVIKLFPSPKNKVSSIIALKNINSTVGALTNLREKTGDSITAFEYMDRNCINLLLERLDIRDILSDIYNHYALVELSSSRKNENLMSMLEDAISSSIQCGDVSDAIVSRNESQSAHFWSLRESLPDLLKSNGDFITFDISLPISQLNDFIEKAESICSDILPNSKAFIFGHIGDGNLHYYLFNSPELSSNEFYALRDKIKTSVYDLTLQMDGSFSAEHGIGLAKKSELIKYSPQSELKLMKLIKKSLDPKNIMNPGKVLD